MNDKIKQFVKQLSPVATIGNWGRVEWSDNIYPQLGDKMYAAIDLEKLAELVVQECVGRLVDMDQQVKGQHNYYKHASIQVMLHFGLQP